MARHASNDNRPLRELVEEAQLKRDLIIRTARRAMRKQGLTPAPVHIPHHAGSVRNPDGPDRLNDPDNTASGNFATDFSETLNLDEIYIEQILDFLEAGVTAAGEFDSTRGEFLVATGRDFRKHGLEQEHYAALGEAAINSINKYMEDTKELTDITELTCSLLAYGAEEDRTDGVHATAQATVLAVEHRCSKVAVVRVQLDPPLPFWPGQFVEVRTPHTPQVWRRLSPANPCNDDGLVEFHVRAAGPFSEGIVNNTVVGERWVVANPYGHLQVSGDHQVVMIAGSTGLAPLRSIILDLAGQDTPPSVQLYFGAQNPGELYDWQGLKSLDDAFDWLQVTAVSERSRIPAGTNPKESTEFRADGIELAIPRNEWVHGLVGDVALDRAQWRNAEILIAGSPSMKRDVVNVFLAAGADPDLIQMDPD
ncbi:flavohemoprotein [Corynebacterium falsenii]|uniref:Flavohemoprotein n=1 Tax=Corynebacterium falsenii TaxID=108486 RepID=A0A418Q5H8_9CORY|nr:FAD-binding oxidoreductase [Corynebacterium falsenii]RIX33859.1 flavohemoprotein [Corynebacterium falsenii]